MVLGPASSILWVWAAPGGREPVITTMGSPPPQLSEAARDPPDTQNRRSSVGQQITHLKTKMEFVEVLESSLAGFCRVVFRPVFCRTWPETSLDRRMFSCSVGCTKVSPATLHAHRASPFVRVYARAAAAPLSKCSIPCVLVCSLA